MAKFLIGGAVVATALGAYLFWKGWQHQFEEEK